jgi:crossover junction endodeoxyribonuclease RusA|uniref:Endodeoxyribonuclease RusA n=1 Tax=Siphoviridae sp. ctksc2 TaxID=2825645 RepID=A0A8S5URY2_9CAUD|nr:MAG TPA: Endodeoxyribonuclease RusA [Siphoviridae sp. ctksc2]
MDSFSFFVPGEPITEGSTKAFTSGQRVVVTHDRGRELDAWRLKVAHAAEAAAEAAYWEVGHDGPVEVWAEFRVPRPKSAPKSRKHAQTKPDLDKLQRAIGDALAPYKRPGVLKDDSRIVGWHAIKRYANDTHPVGVTVRVSKAQDYLTGQVITSVDDIRSLPVDAVIRDAYGNAFHLYLGDWVIVGREGEYTYSAHEIDLPATLVVVDGI